MAAKPSERSTFYVDLKKDVSKAAEDIFEQTLDPKLLSGEIIIAKAQNVLKYNSVGDMKHGMSGDLYCTNFKISFVTAERSSYDMMEMGQRNLLVSENDIPLTCVDAIHQVSSKRSKKTLDPGSNVNGPVKMIEVQCKDFRVYTFSFKFSPRGADKGIVNTILHHAFPTQLPLLFAFSFKPSHVEENGHQASVSKVNVGAPPHFRDRMDWERELTRIGADKLRVTMANQDFKISDSLPEYFAVPSCLTDGDVTQASGHFVDGRVVTWCWSHSNGSSLYRMVPLRPDTVQEHHEKRMLEAVKETHPKKLPSVWVDLDKHCNSVNTVQNSFRKLKELCVPDSIKSFWSSDDKWYAQVDNTKWLQCTRKCLSTAVKAVDVLRKQGKSVILKESEGRDFSCLVSSLVQIILDPHYRTLRGFESLIQREWVVMGHPFLDRYQHVSQTEGEEAPVFLLFLDCVWQLLNQFPSAFSFTDTYLITLWDCSLHGLFETFIFNSERQRYRALMSDNTIKNHTHLISVWDWSLQFREEDIALFNNPLYCVQHGQHLNCPGCNTADVRTFDLKSDHAKENVDAPEQKSPYRKLSQCKQILEENSPQRKISLSSGRESNHVILPEVSAPNIHFWTQCYLRWVPSVHVVGGGPPSEYLQQCMVADKIHYLRMQIHSLQSSTPFVKKLNRDSGLYFTFDTSSKMSENFTSAFPFSPHSTRLSAMFGEANSLTSASGIFFRSSSVSSYDGTIQASGSMSSSNNGEIDEAAEL